MTRPARCRWSPAPWAEKVHYEAPTAPFLRTRCGVSEVVQRLSLRTRCCVRRWRICGSSPSIRSMTATDALREPSRTWRSRARNKARSASTACRRKSGWSATPTTTSWKRTQKGDLDVTAWLEWFLGCLGRAFDATGRRSRRAAQDAFLGARRASDRQRSPAPRAESPARRVYRQAHDAEMGGLGEVLARHGAAGHPEPHRPGPAEEGRRRWAQHELHVSSSDSGRGRRRERLTGSPAAPR